MRCMKCGAPLPGSGVCACGFDWREAELRFVSPLSEAQVQELVRCLDTKEGLELRAARGELRAQVRLGSMCLTGEGEAPKSDGEAAKWFRMAAEQGDRFAQSWMGTFYRDGRGVEQSGAEAAKWFRLAAEQGDLYAQKELGKLYEHGERIEKNDGEAVKWFRMAAEQGDAFAQSWMGTFYRDGRGVEQSGAEAAKWFRLAAEQGDGYSQRELGRVYENDGAMRDSAQAVKWLRLAAEQGDLYAQRELGKLYMDGFHVVRSEAKAEKWLRLAAGQGDKSAKKMLGALEARIAQRERSARQKEAQLQCSLGDAFRDGTGAAQDYDQAMERYRLALTQDPESAYAKYWLGVLEFMKKEHVDLDTANKICNLRSKIERERGEVYAMYQLGCQLIDPKNKKFCLEAEKWLQLAQDQGVKEAPRKLKEVRKLLSGMR